MDANIARPNSCSPDEYLPSLRMRKTRARRSTRSHEPVAASMPSRLTSSCSQYGRIAARSTTLSGATMKRQRCSGVVAMRSVYSAVKTKVTKASCASHMLPYLILPSFQNTSSVWITNDTTEKTISPMTTTDHTSARRDESATSRKRQMHWRTVPLVLISGKSGCPPVMPCIVSTNAEETPLLLLLFGESTLAGGSSWSAAVYESGKRPARFPILPCAQPAGADRSISHAMMSFLLKDSVRLSRRIKSTFASSTMVSSSLGSIARISSSRTRDADAATPTAL